MRFRAANAPLRNLYHAEAVGEAEVQRSAEPFAELSTPGGIDSAEEAQLRQLNAWVATIGLPEGELRYELIDRDRGRRLATLDLAWPDGLQPGLSDPAAVLLNEGPELVKIASQQGFMCFTD